MNKYNNIFIALYVIVLMFLFVPLGDADKVFARDGEGIFVAALMTGMILSIFFHFKLSSTTTQSKLKHSFTWLSGIGLITFIGAFILLLTCRKGLGGLGCGLTSFGIMFLDIVVWAAASVVGLVCIFKKERRNDPHQI